MKLKKKGNNMNEIVKINIKNIDSFNNHPFLVKIDDSLYELADSIKENGLLNPLVVRKKSEGKYEMISRHRRKVALELIGMDEVDAYIKELNEEAIFIWLIVIFKERSCCHQKKHLLIK